VTNTFEGKNTQKNRKRRVKNQNTNAVTEKKQNSRERLSKRKSWPSWTDKGRKKTGAKKTGTNQQGRPVCASTANTGKKEKKQTHGKKGKAPASKIYTPGGGGELGART